MVTEYQHKSLQTELHKAAKIIDEQQTEIERLQSALAKEEDAHTKSLREDAQEIERLRSEREHYRQTYLGVQAEYEKAQTREKRLRAALEEIKAVAGKGAGFYTDRIYTIAREALRDDVEYAPNGMAYDD